MKKDLKILVVNDDGIGSDWLVSLASAAAKFGEVWVAAPSGQCSAMSMRVCISDPITVRQPAFPADVKAAYSIGGSPADCTKLAITSLLPEKPDYVFSGINKGYNAGYDTIYSGTVGAAMEALLNGVPGAAFSTGTEGSFDITEEYIETVIGELLEQPPSLDAIWNVNFPCCAPEELKGILRNRTLAPLSPYSMYYTRREQPDGSFTLKPYAQLVDRSLVPEGSDVHAVYNGYISIGKIRCMVK